MRTVLIAVVCVLLASAAWFVWSARRLTEPERLQMEASAATTLESIPDEAHVLAPIDAIEPAARASAATTSGTITEFHVIDARSDADIERFDVRVVSPDGATDAPRSAGVERHARGRVRLLHPPGAELAISAPGYGSLRSRAHPETDGTQTIRMSRAGGIEGRVTLDGRPAVRARVFVQRDFATIGSGQRYTAEARMYPSRAWSEHETDDSGFFLVTGIAAGTYALRFEYSGAASVLRRGIVVPLELSVDIGEVVLEREAIVRGSIIPPADQSPSIITVMLDGLPQVGAPPSPADFEFRGLAAGTYELTWGRRDLADRSFETDSRRMRIELLAGEVREVIVEAAGSTACELTVFTRSNGVPAAGYFVAATTEIESSDKHVSWIAQSKTESNGAGTLLLPAGVRIRIDVLSETMRKLGSAIVPFELGPGEKRELTIDLDLGTVVVDLPSKSLIPAQGMMLLELRPAQGNSLNVFASTIPNAPNATPHPMWTSNRIEFGAYPVGEYTARVKCMRVFNGQAVWSEGPDTAPSPFEPFETKITVARGLETVIVVPK